MVHHKNHLKNEKSPYLQQHADNPVDWYPWGEAAFEKARQEDKPIFLSIGYATCHWCHVMEHESFEDPLVAQLMNETFVNIKVDREERPDIDAVYMAVCQMMTGSGGWPLTIIMAPDGRPFFAATYIPKESRYGRMGMLDLIPRIRELWQHHRQELLQGANQIVQLLGQMEAAGSSGQLDTSVLTTAFHTFRDAYDETHGGFGNAPKFPSPHNLLFLLRYFHRTSNNTALQMVTHTLTQMRLGGLYDHIGFGFHRYSTDHRWLVPHFEKMLYDQAMLLWAYTEAWQVSGHPLFHQTAQEIATYVLRDMTHPEGAFYSAEDADSEGEEGKFYLWEEAEIRQLLSPQEAQFALKVFNIEAEGNYFEEASGRRTGNNILYLTQPPEALAQSMGMTRETFQQHLNTIRQKLFAARENRVHPLKDDKVLTDWNGLMIAALAFSGRVLNQPSYTRAAIKAARFIETHLTQNNRLWHRYREGESIIAGFLDDYAYYILGLTELYLTTFDIHWLEQGIRFTQTVLSHFADSSGGFYQTPDDGEMLLVRKKEIYDGAIPSGYAVMCYNLVRLARLTGRTEWEVHANQALKAISDPLRKSPRAFGFALTALDFALGPTQEVVIASPAAPDANSIISLVQQTFQPRQVVLLKTPEFANKLATVAPFTRMLTPVDQQPTVYICQNFQCELPITDVQQLQQILNNEQENKP